MKREWRIYMVTNFGSTVVTHKAASLNAVKRMCKKVVNAANYFRIVSDTGLSSEYHLRPITATNLADNGENGT